MKKLIYAIALLVSFPIFAVQLQSSQGPVERAGMILIKVYPNGDPCVLVGKDKRQGYVNFPAGECDQNDRYSSVTAARETQEETGNSLQYTGGFVNNLPYVYSKHHMIQLFVTRDDNLSVDTLTKAVKAAQNNVLLTQAYKEVDQYYAIPIQNLLDAAKKIAIAGYPNSQAIASNGLDAIQSRNGHNLVFEAHYLAAIAQDYANAKNMFENLTGKQFN